MSFAKLTLVLGAAHVAAALWFLLDQAPGTAAALGGLPLDDAWIHMVYARSLAALRGFAYNPGELETGSSSPLWTALLVPASLLARAAEISVVLPAKITGMLVAIAASLGGARLARSLGEGSAVALACGLILALDPSLTFAALSGMEVMLAAGIALWAFALVAEKRPWAASILAGLAPLARPELALLTAVVLGLVEWQMHLEERRWWQRVAVLAPAALCVGSWMLYCLAVSGFPLPSTFYAKFVSRQDFLAHNLGLIAEQILPSWTFFRTGVGLLFCGLGMVLLFRAGLVAAAVAAFPLLFLVAAASSQLIKEASPFYWQRYLLPALPFLLVCAVLGVARAMGWAWRQEQRNLRMLLGVLCAAAVVVSAAAFPRGLRQRADLYAWNCQNIDELNVAMAVWLRDHTPAHETIAVTDAGAARYFSERRILDVIGLNNHRLLHQRGDGMSEIGRVGTVATFPALLPLLRNRAEWQEVHRVVASHLTICNCPQSELVAYRRVAR